MYSLSEQVIKQLRMGRNVLFAQPDSMNNFHGVGLKWAEGTNVVVCLLDPILRRMCTAPVDINGLTEEQAERLLTQAVMLLAVGADVPKDDIDYVEPDENGDVDFSE